MRKGKKFTCVDLSPIYNKICKSKHNRKVLENGDIRIGDKMAMNIKTHVIYKLK